MRFLTIFALTLACSASDPRAEQQSRAPLTASSAVSTAESAAGAPPLSDEELDRLLDALEQELERR